MMSRDTVELFSPTFNSDKDKLRVSSMINSHEQAEFCLRTYALLIEIISEGQISLIFQNEMTMINPILKYVKDPKLSTQNEAKKVVNCISIKIIDL